MIQVYLHFTRLKEGVHTASLGNDVIFPVAGNKAIFWCYCLDCIKLFAPTIIDGSNIKVTGSHSIVRIKLKR